MTYLYQNVTVLQVHDGDTVTLSIDFGFDLVQKSRKFRFYGPDPDGKHGMNAPELNTERGVAARDYLTGLLPVGAAVILRTVKDRTEKFGRYLAVLYLPDGRNVNQLMVDSGHAALKDYTL